MRNLKKKLKNLHKSSAPSGGFKGALWAELDYEHGKLYKKPMFSLPRFAMVPTMALIMVASLGTGGFAYASPLVNSEHVLYPMKLGIEQVEGKFYKTPKSKAQYHARMMERRIQEGEAMLKNQIAVDFMSIADQFDRAISIVEHSERNTDSRDEVMSYLKTSNIRYAHLMEQAIKADLEALNGISEAEAIQIISAVSLADTPVMATFIKDVELVNKTSGVNLDEKNLETLILTDEEKQKVEDRKNAINAIKEQLENVRKRISDSDLTDDEKRELMKEIEVKLKDRLGIETYLDDPSPITPSKIFQIERIKIDNTDIFYNRKF